MEPVTVVPGPPIRVRRVHEVTVARATLRHEGQNVVMEQQTLTTDVNRCIFANRVDLVMLDPQKEEYVIYQGEPALWRPKPQAGASHFLPIGTIMAPSRWRRFLGHIWQAFEELLGG